MASISRGASDPPSSAGTTASPAVPAHRPSSRASVSSGVVPPRCSLGCTASCCSSLSAIGVPSEFDVASLGGLWPHSGGRLTANVVDAGRGRVHPLTSG